MQANILIIEDEQEIADLIALYLKKEGLSVSHCLTGEAGLEQLQKNSFDLLVLDINLPGMDGFEVLQQIRKEKNVPVLILSARQDDSDMIMGFGIGADDYVTKPFSPKVLSARIRARLKGHLKNSETTENRLRFGPWLLDMENHWLKNQHGRLDLPPKEMQLLLTLAEHPGRCITQQELYHQVWGNQFGDLTTVSVHIQRLRKKIESDYRHPQFLMTAYGQGYYLQTEQS